VPKSTTRTDQQLVEKLTRKHQSYLKGAGDDLIASVMEGIEEGAIEGMKKGGREALKECLATGFSHVEAADSKDILQEIPQQIVMSSVKEGTRRIFKKSTEGYVKQACQRLIEKMQEKGVKPSKADTDYILELFKISERETLNKLAAQIPHNPLFGAVIDGMQSALEESLEKNFAACAQRMQSELKRGSKRAN
jgi:hypothetical protein